MLRQCVVGSAAQRTDDITSLLPSYNGSCFFFFPGKAVPLWKPVGINAKCVRMLDKMHRMIFQTPFSFLVTFISQKSSHTCYGCPVNGHLHLKETQVCGNHSNLAYPIKDQLKWFFFQDKTAERHFFKQCQAERLR